MLLPWSNPTGRTIVEGSGCATWFRREMADVLPWSQRFLSQTADLDRPVPSKEQPCYLLQKHPLAGAFFDQSELAVARMLCFIEQQRFSVVSGWLGFAEFL